MVGRHEHALEEGSIRTLGVRATVGGTPAETLGGGVHEIGSGRSREGNEAGESSSG